MLLRHRVSEGEERGGKKLLEVPGHRFQALVTSLPKPAHPPLAVWCHDDGWAECENVIKELREGLSLATLTYNPFVLFEGHLGWQQKVTLWNLLFWLFVTAGVLSHPAGQTTIKLAAPERERQ